MNEQLLQKVLLCSTLPSLPAVAVRVIELTSDENVTMRELAKVIENDQGLSAKILKTVNSAFYGLPQQCASLTNAQTLMGMNAVKTLALGFSLVSSLQDGADDGFNYQSYWRRAVYSAIGAKAVVTMVRCGDAEEAFLGGLLQDVGMIALYKALGTPYSDVVRTCEDDHQSLVNKELGEFDLQHPDVGAMLAERWKLPAALTIPIKYHERPTAAPSNCRQAVRAVALGNLITQVLVQEDRAYWLSQFYQRANQWFSLSAGHSDELIEIVAQQASEVAALLEVDMGKLPAAEDNLELASERIATIALEANRKAMDAAAENLDIRRMLATDPLTGVGTRRRFTGWVAERFEKAKAADEPMSVLLFDVDHFGAINDELGSEVGDVVIVRLAQRLTKLLAPEGGEPHRYGGEEFAVALYDVDRRTATQIAERVRQAISQTPLDMGSVLGNEVSPVWISLSVGVATLDRDTQATLTRGERLIHAADKAVHASKQAGGNCVRAFTPKHRRAA